MHVHQVHACTANHRATWQQTIGQHDFTST